MMSKAVRQRVPPDSRILGGPDRARKKTPGPVEATKGSQRPTIRSPAKIFLQISHLAKELDRSRFPPKKIPFYYPLISLTLYPADTGTAKISGLVIPADAAESNQVHRAVPTAIEGRFVGTRQVPVRFTYPLARNSNIDLKRAGWLADLSPVEKNPPRPGLEGPRCGFWRIEGSEIHTVGSISTCS